MKKKLIALFISFLFVVTIGNSVSSELEDYEVKSFLNEDVVFDSIINLLMLIGHFPSLSACIINRDEVVWEKGYGLYDIENGKHATEDTIYMVCSISKTITGTALMQLYEDGLFDLDDDINDYLSFTLRNPNFPENPITFRMLLSHSSSLRSDPESFYWFNLSLDPPVSWYPDPWLEEYLIPGGMYYVPEIWNENYAPGEVARYANANFVISAYLVELLSGESFINYCNENIFQSLDMQKTSFNLSEFDIENVAIPYHFENGRYVTIDNIDWLGKPPNKYYRMLHYPVGGLYTSVLDLSHFLIAHMNGGVYKGVRILNEDTIEEMHKIQPPGTGYGLAWYYTGRQFGNIYSGHEGDVPGYHNSMLIQYSNDEIGVILFVTGDRYTILGSIVAELIRDILFLKANIIYKDLVKEVKWQESSFNIKPALISMPLINRIENQYYD